MARLPKRCKQRYQRAAAAGQPQQAGSQVDQQWLLRAPRPANRCLLGWPAAGPAAAAAAAMPCELHPSRAAGERHRRPLAAAAACPHPPPYPFRTHPEGGSAAAAAGAPGRPPPPRPSHLAAAAAAQRHPLQREGGCATYGHGGQGKPQKALAVTSYPARGTATASPPSHARHTWQRWRRLVRQRWQRWLASGSPRGVSQGLQQVGQQRRLLHRRGKHTACGITRREGTLSAQGRQGPTRLGAPSMLSAACLPPRVQLLRGSAGRGGAARAARQHSHTPVASLNRLMSNSSASAEVAAPCGRCCAAASCCRWCARASAVARCAATSSSYRCRSAAAAAARACSTAQCSSAQSASLKVLCQGLLGSATGGCCAAAACPAAMMLPCCSRSAPGGSGSRA